MKNVYKVVVLILGLEIISQIIGIVTKASKIISDIMKGVKL